MFFADGSPRKRERLAEKRSFRGAEKQPVPEALNPGVIFAAALVAAGIGGYAAKLFRAPRIIGYLVMGLLLKATMQRFAPAEVGYPSESLRFVTDLSLGLILFMIGGVFESRRLKAVKATLGRLSLAETSLTFLLTAVVCAGAAWTLPGAALRPVLAAGLLLGAAAVATAPAATYLVLREYEAKGPTTNHLLALTGINNLASIIGFGLVLSLCTWLGWVDTAGGAAAASPWTNLLFASVGSILLGAAAGLFLSLLHAKLPLPETLLAFFAVLFLLATGDDSLKLLLGTTFNSMVACLAMGAVFENLTTDPRRFEQTLETVGMPLFAVFFVLAGYELHLGKIPETLGLTVAYVVARTAGKVGGVWLGVQSAEPGTMVRWNAGLGLLCQAGVAIGLGATLRKHWRGGFGENLNTVILSSVALYELTGPLLVKNVVVRAGEVKALSLLRRDRTAERPGRRPLWWKKPAAGLLKLVRRRRAGLAGTAGRGERAALPETLTAKHIMRANVRCLAGNAALDEVLHFVEGSRLHDFPVVDAERKYVGLVHFRTLRGLVYDPTLAHLVTAADLADETVPTVHPDRPLAELLELFHRRELSALPVVEQAETAGVEAGTSQRKKLLGVVEQRDLLHALHRDRAVPAAEEQRRGILLAGAGPVARALAGELQLTRPVALLDTNADNCAAARAAGLRAFHGDALHEDELRAAGAARACTLIAVTPNESVNLAVGGPAAKKFGIPEILVLRPPLPPRTPHPVAFVPPAAATLFGKETDLLKWDRLLEQGLTERATIKVDEVIASKEFLARAAAKAGTPLLPLVVEREGERLPVRGDRKLHTGDQILVLRRRETNSTAPVK